MGPHQYPTTNRTPVTQRYHFIDIEPPAELQYQRPSRQRLARITKEQIRQAAAEQNVDLLNEVATQRKLPGYQSTRIAIDNNGKGLCLKATQFIAATSPTSKSGLCEYSGTERLVDPNEHVNSVPMRQLMYGCEYYRDDKHYRKSPDQDLDSLLRYMQAPSPGEEPTCRLLITVDKANFTYVSLSILRPLQPEEELTIEYGGPYWQIFWHHLSLEQQRRMRTKHPDLVFPPHWPQVIPAGYRNQKVSNQLESDYSLAARNIYDVLSTLDRLDEDDQDGDADIWSPGTPSQDNAPMPDPPISTTLPPIRLPSQSRLNTSIIATIDPRKHIFREWTPQPFTVNGDVGLDVGKTIIRHIAKALDHPTPAFPSTKDLRRMMMCRVWKTQGIDTVHAGDCGPQMQRCLQDVLEEVGDLNEVDMKEQITIRMTKTMRQDDPPHYSTQDSKLIRHITEGLIEWVSDDLRNEWYQQANRYIVVGDQSTSQCLEQCDCAVEITMNTSPYCTMDPSPT